MAAPVSLSQTQGVYRAYLEDGTVVDAARLTPEQIQTWIDVRAPHLSEGDAAKERQLYTGVDGKNVSEAQLLVPLEELLPKTQLGSFAKDAISARDVGPLVGERQVNCPTFYCTASVGVCRIYGCSCNGVICVVF